MKILNSCLLAISAIAFSSASVAADYCGMTTAEDEPKLVVIPATDSNWMICLLHRSGIDDGKGAISVTVRERKLTPSPVVKNDLFNGVIIQESLAGPDDEHCMVFGVKSTEELAIVRTAGTPNNRLVKICPS